MNKRVKIIINHDQLIMFNSFQVLINHLVTRKFSLKKRIIDDS